MGKGQLQLRKRRIPVTSAVPEGSAGRRFRAKRPPRLPGGTAPSSGSCPETGPRLSRSRLRKTGDSRLPFSQFATNSTPPNLNNEVLDITHRVQNHCLLVRCHLVVISIIATWCTFVASRSARLPVFSYLPTGTEGAGGGVAKPLASQRKSAIRRQVGSGTSSQTVAKWVIMQRLQVGPGLVRESVGPVG